MPAPSGATTSDRAANPLLLERLGINAVFNPGAIELGGKILLVARVEGVDRKSFFAVAESASGGRGISFLGLPHQARRDGGSRHQRLRHAPGAAPGRLRLRALLHRTQGPAAPVFDTSSAVAQCGIARTKDLVTWQRAPRSGLRFGPAAQRGAPS